MKYRAYFVSLFLLFFSVNFVSSKISISGNSIEELKQSIFEFEEMLPKQEIYVEPKLGFADVYLKKVGDKYDDFVEVLKSNQRFLKLTGVSGAYVYGKYINPEFFPNLIKNAASTSINYLSLFMDSLFKGVWKGVLDNKSMTGKIVGSLIFYSIINNVLGIGLKSAAEYFVTSSKKEAENKNDEKYYWLKKKNNEDKKNKDKK